MRFAIGPWKELLFGQRGLEKKRGQKSAASRGRKSRLEPLEPRHLLSTTILMPDADAQLRDGSGAAKNFGIHPSLVVRNDNGLDQQAILRFDLSGIHGNVTWARLELPRAIYAPDSSGSVPRLELEWLDNDHWSETLVTMDQVDSWETPHFIRGFRGEYHVITDVIQETMETGNHVITFRIRDQYANEPGFVAYRAHESESTASPRLRVQSESTDNSLGFTTAGMHRYWPGGSHGSGGGDEDDAAGTVTASGTQLQLTGDAWKAAVFNYEVTTRTVLEFEFQSTSEGVAHAIGLDTNLSYNANADHLFVLAGARSDPTKTWTHTEYADDGIGDGWRTYRIPVGEFLGSSNLTQGYVTFVNDQMVQDPQATSTFRNVRFREAGRVTNYYLDPLHGDFDGDGQTETLRLDLTGRWVKGADGTANWLGERPRWDLGGGATRGEHHGVVGDFNGDGYDDVAARTRSSNAWQVAVAIEKEFRLADSVWGAWGLTESWEPHYVGDFNGDARDDLVRIDYLTGGLEVSLSTGASFSTSVWEAWDLGVDWQDIRIADFTGDGRDDLAAKHAVTGDWSLAVSDGTRFLTSSVDAPAGWNDTLLGDFDGDERAELLVWDGSHWRVIEYEDAQLVRQQYDVGDALKGLGREFYMHVGDVILCQRPLPNS